MIFSGIFLFSLVAVSQGQMVTNCITSYGACLAPIASKDYKPCSDTHLQVSKCITDVTSMCHPLIVDIMKDYERLLREECPRDSHFINDTIDAWACLVKNGDRYRHCELMGTFRTAADVCESLDLLFTCISSKMKSLCGSKLGESFRKNNSPVNNFISTCKTSESMKDYELSDCAREIMICDRNFFSRDGYSCKGIERNFKCYVQIAKIHCGYSADLSVIVLEKYVAQMPDYCNPESEFRQNLAKSLGCIIQESGGATNCQESFKVGLQKAMTDDTNDSAKRTAAVMRVVKSLINCIVKHFETSCGEEAAFVASYLSAPVEQLTDDICTELTGNICSGTVGMECSALLLVLSVAYMLMKDE